MSIKEIKIDRGLCIGAGTCVVFAPNTFELDNELKAVLKKIDKKDSDEDIISAAKSCPTLAIILEDDQGKQIYP
jgi:ferredoxin